MAKSNYIVSLAAERDIDESIVYKPADPLQILRVLSGFRDIINLL